MRWRNQQSQDVYAEAAQRLLPALVFPRVYREFLRQECDAADFPGNGGECRELLARVGWKRPFYQRSLSSDDEGIDGPFGPQQMLHRLQVQLNETHAIPLGTSRPRIMQRVVDVLGVPPGQDDRAVQDRLRMEAGQLLAQVTGDDEKSLQLVVRALANITAAKLGCDPPWKKGGTMPLAIQSPNSGRILSSIAGSPVIEVPSTHDVSDCPGLAADMLSRMCWLPVTGGSHVPIHSKIVEMAAVYLSSNPHLHDRTEAVLSSMYSIVMQWDAADMWRVESCLRERRVSYHRRNVRDQAAILLQCLYPAATEEMAVRGQAADQELMVRRMVVEQANLQKGTPAQAASAILENTLVVAALLGVEPKTVLGSDCELVGQGIGARVEQRIASPLGVDVPPVIAAMIEADGLPAFSRLAPPAWSRHLSPQARASLQEAELVFASRVTWEPFPRVPEAPASWASVVALYARVVEAELLYRYMEPAAAAAASEYKSHELGKVPPDNPGAWFAKWILSRQGSPQGEREAQPTLGQMHFLMSWRGNKSPADLGRRVLGSLRRAIATLDWRLVTRRSVQVLEVINEMGRVRHPRAEPVEREVALFWRRVSMDYLQMCVEGDDGDQAV